VGGGQPGFDVTVEVSAGNAGDSSCDVGLLGLELIAVLGEELLPECVQGDNVVVSGGIQESDGFVAGLARSGSGCSGACTHAGGEEGACKESANLVLHSKSVSNF
jgi:hypothetical protein